MRQAAQQGRSRYARLGRDYEVTPLTVRGAEQGYDEEAGEADSSVQH